MKNIAKFGLTAILVASFSSVFAGGMGGMAPPPPPAAPPPPPPPAAPPPPPPPGAPEDARFEFKADLSLAQILSPVIGAQTAQTGDITIAYADDLSSLQYTYNVANIDPNDPITASHLHCAPAGENSAPVAVIEVGTFTLTNADIIPTMGDPVCGTIINNIASLLKAMLDGKIYANSHTADTGAPGILRGQIFAAQPEADD